MFIATHATRVGKLRRSTMSSSFVERDRGSEGPNPPFMPLLRSLLQSEVVVATNMSLLTELDRRDRRKCV